MENQEKKASHEFVRFLGKEPHFNVYHGHDGNETLDLKKGDVAKVSDDKALQLFSDYPTAFETASEEDYLKSSELGKAPPADKGKPSATKGKKK